MLKKAISYTYIILTALLIIQLHGQEKSTFKIIVNKSNSIKSIGMDELQKIFLKKHTKWKSGEIINPVDLNESSKIREDFTDIVHNKRVSAIKAYWQKQIFTGRGVPPPEKPTEKEVLEYIEKNEGAIGYVSSKKSITKYDVKVISIDN